MIERATRNWIKLCVSPMCHRNIKRRPTRRKASLKSNHLRLIFHEQLICGNDALHLSLVSTPVRVVFFGKLAGAALNLLMGGIRLCAATANLPKNTTLTGVE